jgi:hypothetical protein
MKKNKLFVISLITALLICSALSVVSAQDTLDSTVAPDSTINPDDTRSIDDNQTVTGGEPILYASDDNSTDVNATETVDLAAQDGLIYANGIAEEDTQANSWVVPVVGAVLAIAVGGVVGVVIFRKTKAKN